MEAAAATFPKMMSLNFASIFLLIILLSRPDQASSACFKSIISFGDSMADTGNSIRLETLEAASPPYGKTFFQRPTGRWSDGRLIIDFIAEAVGLPYVEPFLGEKNIVGNGGGGVNFAVGGCTALPRSFLAKKGIQSPTDVSLSPQFTWFKEEFLPKICTKPSDCKNFLEAALVMVGEIGVNDYNYAFLQGKSELVQSFIPIVVQQIGSTINELVELGATTLMVPGTLPFGCSSILLTYFFLPSKQTDYDPKTGCLDWLNSLSRQHNHLLQLELQRLRLLHPNVNIIYADYYNAAMPIYRSPQKYGFSEGGLRACCGGGGPYNADSVAPCGTRGSNTCDDPSSHVSWDGLHLTDAANGEIADALLRSFTTPRLNTSCALDVPLQIM